MKLTSRIGVTCAKHLTIRYIGTLLLLPLAGSNPALAQLTTPCFFAPYTAVAPTIDGVIVGDPGWNKAMPQTLNFARVGGPELNAETVYMVHDGTYIYVGVVSNTTDGFDSQGWVRFDGNNNGVLDGSAIEPHTDIQIDQGAPSAWAGYTNYAYFTACDAYDYVLRPSGTGSACANPSNLTYEFKVALADLTLNPGREAHVLLMSQQALGHQSYNTYMYPVTATCTPLNWARVGLERQQPYGWAKVADSGPNPRYQHAMAYDATRQRVVLFGGQDSSGQYYGDTWEWDGTSWSKRSDIGPSPRNGAAMVYDAARNKCVLEGGGSPITGVVGDTWEWDGTAWTNHPGTGPATGYQAMAYDSTRQRVVLFGGHSNGYQSYTWEWDGASWTQLDVSGPSARSGHSMAYDATRARTVLFGGGGPVSTNETWEWDGTAWTQRVSTVSPSPRYGFGMAYDSSRGRTVVFGGQDLAANRDTGTWEWDGTTWAKTVDAGPGARVDLAMAYDSARGQTVLFGGYTGSSTAMGDTWIYNGIAATHLGFTTQPGGAPSSRPLSPQPVVCALRDDGSLDTGFNGTITVRIKPGTGAPTGSLGGTTTVNVVNGCATFTNVAVYVGATGYQLQAFASPPLIPSDSNPFDISDYYPWGDLNKDQYFNIGDIVKGLRVLGGLDAAPSE